MVVVRGRGSLVKVAEKGIEWKAIRVADDSGVTRPATVPRANTTEPLRFPAKNASRLTASEVSSWKSISCTANAALRTQLAV